MKSEPKILDGKWLSKLIQATIQLEVAELSKRYGRAPGLGVILVGENPASQTYVASKEKTAKQCGLATFDMRIAAASSLERVQAGIQELNASKEIDGILLQLPLPEALEAHTNDLLNLISPEKDADGLHPLNQGLLMRGEATVKPCTPLGIMRLIDLAYEESTSLNEADDISQASLSGKKAVVIGRSLLVGKPIGIMLLERNATVTYAHSRTPDLKSVVKDADIIVAAVGVPQLVKKDWVKPGAVVIDVGINRLPTGKLAGDVDFEEVSKVAGAITPVPGGVGPMTVTMLIYNTVQAFKRAMTQ